MGWWETWRVLDSANPIACFDADSPPALAAVRSLGRAGLHVHVYSHKRFTVAGASRFTAKQVWCPDAANASSFLPWLREGIRSGRISAIFPTSDRMAFYLAEVFDDLPNAMQALVPEPKRAHDALFKDAFARACAQHGQATPATTAFGSVDEAREQAERFDYPVVLKPCSHITETLFRGTVAASAAALREQLHELTPTEGMEEIAGRYPQSRIPIVQAYLRAKRLVAVSGIIGLDGSILCAMACEKTRQWPPSLGVGTAFEPVQDTALVDQGARFAAQVLGRGMFELELVLDEHGTWNAIDLNPRAYGQMALNIACGHDLPLLWATLLRGDPVAPLGVATADTTWRHGIPFHTGEWVGAMRGPNRMDKLKHYAQALTSPSVDVVFSRQDPVPWGLFFAQSLRHPRALVRPFFREKSPWE